MFRSVRSRITLFATLVVAVALFLSSVLIVRMVESDLLDTTERALRAELELEANSFGFDEDFDLFEFESDGVELGFGIFLEDGGLALGGIFDPVTGDAVVDVVIDTTTGEIVELLDPFTGGTIEASELQASIEQLDLDFLDVDGDEGNQLIVGAVARDEVDQTLSSLRSVLTAVVPLLTLAMGALIWWLVGRALRPVRAMSERVEAITTSNLDQRVPVPAGSDAVADLASVMNTMLERLEEGDARQREFAADASHELRSPLSSVRAAAELLERRPGSDRASALAGDIVAEADRMDQLIGDLLSLSRIDDASAAATHRPVDLSVLMHESLDAMTEKPVQREIETDVVVLGDSQQLTRAIDNLVANADRHANAQVRLVLTVDGDNQQAVVHVDDDGQGVPVDKRAVIFERFSRLDEARSRDAGGVGLGLALVKAIAQRHRGSVHVDTAPGLGGARFTLRLPLADPTT